SLVTPPSRSRAMPSCCSDARICRSARNRRTRSGVTNAPRTSGQACSNPTAGPSRPSRSRYSWRGARSAQRVLVGDVSVRGAGEEPELVLAHQRIVAKVDVQGRRLLHLAKEVRLVLEDVQRDVRVHADRDLLLVALDGEPADGALDPADD